MRRLALALALIAVLGAPATARPLPVRVASPDIVVRAEAGMESLAHDIVVLAPAALERIRADLAGLPTPARVEVRLVHESSSLAQVAPDGARVPDWAAGVAFPRAGVVAVATRRDHEPISVASTVVHELAHMALGAALDGRAPRWLDEGFAYLHSSDVSLARAQTLTGLAWSGDRYFLYELEASFPAGENEAGRAYAQSYDFVAFLARRGRWSDPDDDGNRDPLRVMLARMATGSDVRVAAEFAYGAPLEQLEAEWWQSLRERYLFAFIGLFSAFVWVVGAVLLVLGWWRRRRHNRARLDAWARDEAAAARANAAAAPTPLAGDADADAR